jgi:hypothetical protein
MLITKFPYLYQHIYFVVSKRASLFKIHVIKFILIIVGMKVLEKNHHSTQHKRLLPKFKLFIMILTLYLGSNYVRSQFIVFVIHGAWDQKMYHSIPHEC